MIQISELKESVAFAALKNDISDRGMIDDIRKDKSASFTTLVNRIRIDIEAEDSIKQKYGEKSKRQHDEKTSNSGAPRKKTTPTLRAKKPLPRSQKEVGIPRCWGLATRTTGTETHKTPRIPTTNSSEWSTTSVVV